MIIHPPVVIDEGSTVILQAVIEHSGKQETLWYSFDKKYKQHLTTEKLDGFLVGVLLLGMKLGEDIIVKSALSEKLFYNLTNYYMNIMCLVMPDLKSVKILPDSLDNGKDNNCEQAVVTGFSAGIDSFCVLYDHLVVDVPPGYKITHFVFNNVGSHGADVQKEGELFHKRFDLIKGFANEVGVEFVKINSNLSAILQMDFAQTHVPRNASSLLLLQKLFSKYYYASTYSYQDSFVGKTHSMGYTDASAVHLLSTETLDCISSGGQHTRLEKTRRTVLVENASQWLNVCVSTRTDGKNCSECWKCCRTLMTLDLLGVLENFSSVFDLNKWKYVRNWYIRKTVLNRKNRHPFVREMREYADTIGYSFPARQRILARTVDYIPAPIYNVLRSAVGRVLFRK